MNTDFLRTLNAATYPFDAHYAKELRDIFEDQFLRELTGDEKKELGAITFAPLLFGNRSGSNLLTECLYRAGMGFPEHGEPMNTPSIRKIMEQQCINTFTDYFLFLVRRFQKNGVVGFKLSIGQLFDLTRTGLTNHFCNIKLLHCLRHDRLAQAVSHHIAKSSGNWSTLQSQESRCEPSYSAEAIMQFLRRGAKLEADYRLYCTIHGTRGMEVWHEDFIRDPSSHIRAIAQFLNCDADLSTVNLKTTSIQPQGNETNKRFARQFREDLHLQK